MPLIKCSNSAITTAQKDMLVTITPPQYKCNAKSEASRVRVSFIVEPRFLAIDDEWEHNLGPSYIILNIAFVCWHWDQTHVNINLCKQKKSNVFPNHQRTNGSSYLPYLWALVAEESCYIGDGGLNDIKLTILLDQWQKKRYSDGLTMWILESIVRSHPFLFWKMGDLENIFLRTIVCNANKNG